MSERPKKKLLSRRAKWIIAICIVLVGGPIAVRVIAGYVMEAKLEARFQAMRGAGEPMTMAELAPDEVDDDENAALLYEEAFPLIDGITDERWLRFYELLEKEEPLTSDEVTEAQAWLDSVAEIFRLIDEGLKLPGCRYSTNYNASPFVILLPNLSKVQSIGRLLRLSSRVHLEEGRVDAATEECVKMLKIGDSLRDEPILISMLVRIAVSMMAMDQLESVLTAGAPSADQLRRVKSVLGNAIDRSDFVLALQGERCSGISIFDVVLNQPGKLTGALGLPMPPMNNLSLLLCRPMVISDALFYLDVMEAYIEVAGKPTYEVGAASASRLLKK